MIAQRPHTYAAIDHWRQYQTCFPKRIQITAGREPYEEWWSWRGAQIHLDLYPAPAAPLSVIVLHGGGGYGRLLAPYGWMLHQHGFEVVLPDLPGYGLSIVPRKMFHCARWVECVVDLVEAQARRTGRPVVLLGMSLGGFIAYLAAARGRTAVGVLATTLADPRQPIVRDQFARHPRLNRLLAGALPLAATLLRGLRLPIRWLSNMDAIANDADLARLLRRDPLGGGNCVPLHFLESLLKLEPALEPEEFDLCPVLLAQPAADRWTTVDASLPFLNRIRGPREFLLLENCGHLPIEEPGVTQFEDAAVAFLMRAMLSAHT